MSQDRRNLCCCRHSDCRDLQEALAAAGHPLGGSFTFKVREGEKNVRYQSVLRRNLSDPTAKLTNNEYLIARHHWEQTAHNYFAGDNLDGTFSAPRYPTTPVNSKIATAYCFNDGVNEYRGKYFWPPRNSIADIRSLVASLTGTTSRSERSRKRHIGITATTPGGGKRTKASASITPEWGKLPAESTSEAAESTSEVAMVSVADAASGPNTTETIHPALVYDVCSSGVGHSRVDDVANSGVIGRGICAGYFSYTRRDGVWRSNNCAAFVRGNGVYSDKCNSCAMVCSDISPLTYPDLYSGSRSGTCASLVAPLASVSDALVDGYLRRGDAFLTTKQCYSIAGLLQDHYPGTSCLNLDDGRCINICHGFPGANCLRVFMSKNQRRNIIYCNPCRAEKRNNTKREKRAQENRSQQVQAGSTCPWIHLSPSRQANRRENERKARRSISDRLRYAKKRLQDPDLEVIVDAKKNEELLNLFKNAASHVASGHDHKQGLLADLIKSTVENELSNGEAPKKECDDLASFMLDEINNASKRMAGNDSQVRFSPHTMRIAMQLWMRSSSGYKALKESSLFVLPSVSTLKAMKAKLSVNEGLSPSFYGWFFDTLVREEGGPGGKGCAGHMFCDEMKLKAGVVWNTANLKVIGLVGKEGKLDIQDDLKVLLSENLRNDGKGTAEGENQPEGDGDAGGSESYEPATYVNQWKFRSIYGKTFLLNFFFNSGSLDSNELIRQLLHTLLMVEMVGVKNLGILVDAGGGNSRLFSLLRHGKRIDNSAWLPDDCVTFVNPADTTRKVAMFFCSTHNMKSQRNAQHKSTVIPKPKWRTFTTAEGVRFGIESLERCWDREQKRKSRVTPLSLAAVAPDKWNKMRVGPALAVFKHDTTVELMEHTGKELDCWQQLVASGEYESTVTAARREIDIAKSRVEILKAKLREVNASDELRQDVAYIEYCSNVCTIFVQYFMNKDPSVHVTTSNIDEIEKDVKYSLEYFERWRQASLSLKASDPGWDKAFISTTTYKNMRIGVSGFFTYCRLVFDLPEPPEYVSFLHSNTSSLEATYSHMRAIGADSPPRYGAALTSLNCRGSMKLMNTVNPWYCHTGDENEEASDVGQLERVMGRKEEAQSAEVGRWRESLKKAAEISVTILPSEALGSENRNDAMADLWNKMKSMVIDDHFCDYLFADETFLGVAEASVGTDNEHWFKSMGTLEAEDKVTFDLACQQFVEKIFVMFETTIAAHDRSTESSLWYQVYKYTASKRIDADSRHLPSLLQQSHLCTGILFYHLARLFDSWLHEGVSKIIGDRKTSESLGECDSAITVEEENSEVTRFVGWAMRDVLNEYTEKYHETDLYMYGGESDEGEDLDEDGVELREIVEYIRGMQLLHSEALKKPQYLRDCYAPIDQLRNRGGLFLVAPQYIDFSRALMNSIRSLVNQDAITNKGESVIRKSYSDIVGDKSIWNLFRTADNPSNLSCNETKRQIYIKILRKAFDARTGEETNKYNEKKTSRYANAGNNMTHREKMKGLAVSEAKSAAKRLTFPK